MKTFKMLAGAAALLAMSALAACSSDEPIGTPDPGQAEGDETRYLAIQIATPNDASRAEFEVGSANESKINTLDFIFYDINGNITSSVQHLEYVAGTGTPDVGKFNDSNLNDGNYDPVTSDGNATGDYNVNRIWHSVVPVNLVQGQNLPSYVLCLVNAQAATVNSVVDAGNMSALRDSNNPIILVGNGFVMSNSVYYGTNELTGQENQRMSATPIKAETQLFPTREAAQAAITALDTPNANSIAVVDIYVERKAAKVGLTMKSDAVHAYELPYYTSVTTGEGEEAVTSVPNVKLTFVPEYWFVNATAEKVYLTKRFLLEGIQYPEYNEMNAAFTGTAMAATWNAPILHRSFWGCSPSYWDATYPSVSDNVNDLLGTESYDYSVNYFSYKDVVRGTANPSTGSPISVAATTGEGLARSFAATMTADGAQSNGYIYTMETTTASSIIRDTKANPAATVASAVIVGHYHVQVGDGDAQEMNESVFYVQPNVNDGKGAYFPNVTAVRNYLAASQRTLFADNQGNAFAATTLADYVVEHPRKAVRDALTASGINGNLAGYVVALQLSKAPENTVYFFDPTNGQYTPVTEANLARVNAALYQNGTMNVYNHGRAFFNIPIRHLGFNGDNGNNTGAEGNLIDANGKIKWEDTKIGDLGVVRNHVYNVTVSGISGLGTGLRSDDEPIVPAKDDMNQYVAMRLNVLQWRVVNSWSVSL